MSANLSSMTQFDHADIKEVAYKMTEVRDNNNQDPVSVEAEHVDFTIFRAPTCSSQERGRSVQHLEGEAVRLDMHDLSVR
jgi:hypothetical protein